MKALQFFRQLAANNNREWFKAHKDRYDALSEEWKEGMERVQGLVTPHWPQVRYASVKTFRIYRDTRFSHDKTPYKLHLGSVLAPPSSQNVHHPGVYIECGYESHDSGVFAGVWAPESATLNKLRHAMVDNIEEFREITDNPAFTKYFPAWYGETLKTAPKGWPKDHPDIDLLRLKHIGRQSDMPIEVFDSPGWEEKVARRIIAAVPFMQFLDYSLFEE